jgi:hypothetical protein
MTFLLTTRMCQGGSHSVGMPCIERSCMDGPAGQEYTCSCDIYVIHFEVLFGRKRRPYVILHVASTVRHSGT